MLKYKGNSMKSYKEELRRENNSENTEGRNITLINQAATSVHPQVQLNL